MLLILIITRVCGYVKGQEITYGYIDSLSYQLYLKGHWDSLIITGQLAEKANIIYPNLNMRIGYAAMMKGNNSFALKNYNKVLEYNSFNEDAIYYAVLNNTLLSRREAACFRSKSLSADLKKSLLVNTGKLFESIDTERSFKPTNNNLRKSGHYSRLGLGHRLNYRLKLYQSFALYKQDLAAEEINYNAPANPPGSNNYPIVQRVFSVSDLQYYVKSEFHINSKFSIINAFHFANTNFDNSTYKTSIVNCGIKYFNPYADFKLELNTGPMLDSLLTQVAFSSTYYPLGNLNLYLNSRLSYQKRTSLSQLNFYQMLGLKVHKKLWIETQGTFGQIKNMIDNEALYIYSALDVSKFRAGISVIIPVNSRFSITSNYSYEQKKLSIINTNYNLHSYSIALSWKL